MDMNEEEEDGSPDQADKWRELRTFLKELLLTGAIPAEPKEMRPRAVFLHYQDEPVFEVVNYQDKKAKDKFGRLLLSLRKKHLNGDLVNENSPDQVMWLKSAAKQYLKKCFRQEIIPADFVDHEQVWKDHCENHKAFARMKYDDAFVRRLDSVRKDYLKKIDRAESDLNAYKAAKQNHPTPLLNH